MSGILVEGLMSRSVRLGSRSGGLFGEIAKWWLAAFTATAALGAALDCNQLPPPDSRKGFFANFVNECYVLGLTTSGVAGVDPIFETTS